MEACLENHWDWPFSVTEVYSFQTVKNLAFTSMKRMGSIRGSLVIPICNSDNLQVRLYNLIPINALPCTYIVQT